MAGEGSDEFVYEVLQKLLPAADILRHVALLQNIGLDFLQRGLTGFDLRANA